MARILGLPHELGAWVRAWRDDVRWLGGEESSPLAIVGSVHQKQIDWWLRASVTSA